MNLKRNLWTVASVLVLIVAALLTHARHTRSALAAQASAAALDLPPAGAPEPASVRILAGISSPTFVDALGTSWSGDKYFSGGSAESISPRAIAFAQDPSIFLHRRRGAFSYTIPLSPGKYELRLYFSDAFFGENNPDGGGEASRVFDVRANGRLLLRNFDVVSDAGGSNTADVKVFRSIQPDASGKLQIDFLPKRDVAFVNAIEIVPTPQDRTTPLRMVMAKSGYGDPAGNWWEPDRFYRGGVSFSKPANAAKTGTSIPRSERFGNFVYAIPVAANETYKATLTFKEVDPTHLLGDTPGERIDIFSVFVNGRPLIERLELGLNQGHSPMIQRTFRGLQPNAQDKLIFSFVPIRNYALVNSIEVVEDE